MTEVRSRTEGRGIRRGRRRASRLLAITALVSAFSLGLANAAYADVTTVTGSAYGISASVNTLLGTTPVLAPTPAVTLPPGGSPDLVFKTTQLVTLPGLVSTGVINASTKGTLGPNGFTTAGADLNGVVVLNLLQVDEIGATCVSDATGSSAETKIANLEVQGKKLVVATLPNTTVALPGIGTLHVNEQKVTGSGASTGITVNGLRLELNVLGLVRSDIIFAHAVCGVGSA